LAHSPISVIPVAPEPIVQVALMVAMAMLLQPVIPTIPALLSQRSRAPPV
jgi:hypothetical protein